MKRGLQPGDKIGHATVISVSRASLPTGVGRVPRANTEVWARLVSATDDRLVFAFSIPPRTLWPNGRPNRWKKAAAVKEHREAAAVAAYGVVPEPWESAVASEAWYFRDLQRRDVRNFEASMKSYYDGLVEGGVLVDDDATRLRHLPSVVDCDRSNPRVELTLERSPGVGEH